MKVSSALFLIPLNVQIWDIGISKAVSMMLDCFSKSISWFAKDLQMFKCHQQSLLFLKFEIFLKPFSFFNLCKLETNWNWDQQTFHKNRKATEMFRVRLQFRGFMKMVKMQANKWNCEDLFLWFAWRMKNMKTVVECRGGDDAFETINNESSQKIAVINFLPLRKKKI